MFKKLGRGDTILSTVCDIQQQPVYEGLFDIVSDVSQKTPSLAWLTEFFEIRLAVLHDCLHRLLVTFTSLTPEYFSFRRSSAFCVLADGIPHLLSQSHKLPPLVLGFLLFPLDLSLLSFVPPDGIHVLF